MIKKQGNKNKLKNMNFKKILGLFLVFSMFTALGSANIADITSKNIDPVYVDEFEQITFTMNVQGDDGIEELGIIVTDPDGNTVKDTITTYDGTQTQVDFTDYLTLGSTDPQGEYDVEFYTKDGALTYSEFSTFYYKIEEPTPTWNLINPDDGETINYPADQTGANINFETDITPESSGDVQLFIDLEEGSGFNFNSYYTETVSGSGTTTVSSNQLISEGDGFEYFFRYTRDSTGNTFDSNRRTFNVNEVDNPPTIDSITFNPSSPTVGDNVDVTFEATDDSQIESYDAQAYNPNGNQVASLSDTNNDATVDFSALGFFNADEQGEWEVEFTVEDDSDQTTTETETVQVGGENSPTFSINEPQDNSEIILDPGQSTTTVNYDGNIDADFSGTLELIRDGTTVGNENFGSGGESYSFSETLSLGNYSYKVEATSDSTGTTYSSNTYSFEIRQAEETQPTFNFENPVKNEVFTYNPDINSDTTIRFEGSVSASWNGEGNVTVTDNQGNPVGNFDFTHTAETTFYGDSASDVTLSKGNYSYKFYLESNDTGTVYERNTVDFKVLESTDPRPTTNIQSITGTYGTEILDKTIDYTANVEAQFNGNASIYLQYPIRNDLDTRNVKFLQSQQITSGNNVTISGSYDFDTFNILPRPGKFDIFVELVSNDTGIPYTDSSGYSVSYRPDWNFLNPNQTSVDVTGLQNFKDTNFEANISNVFPGEIQYQLQKPDESTWQTIETFQVQEYRDIRLDFNSVIEGLSYTETINNTRYTGNYSTRLAYTPVDEDNTYFSPEAEYNYRSTPGFVSNAAIWANNFFGEETGTLILATMIVMLSAVYVGLITESGSATLFVTLAEAVTFSIIGWYPAWVSMLLFMFGIGIGYKIFTDNGGG